MKLVFTLMFAVCFLRRRGVAQYFGVWWVAWMYLLGDGDRSLGVGGVEFDGECIVLSFTHSKHPHFQIQGRSMPITSNLLSEL